MRSAPARSLPFLGFVLCLTAACTIVISQTPTFRITGVVINSVTGSPVALAHLETSPAGRQQRRRGQQAAGATDADDHGRFSVALPSAGSWSLTASSPGYVRQSYDAHGGYSSSIVVTAASPSLDLRFLLPPEGHISGTVVDEAGEAVRNANVELLVQPPAGPANTPAPPFQRRSFAQTDDRGAYEFANLAPANYQISVQAKPWYASMTQRQTFGTSSATAPLPPVTEPSLDVTYQQVWYPGASDALQAETISLAAGEERHADFHLNPIPSLHLQIISQPAPDQNGQRQIPSFPMVERIDGGGNRGFMQAVASTGAQGVVDIGGLTPGTYRVTMQGPGQPNRSTIIQMTEGASRTVDLRQPTAGLANIAVQFDGDDDDDQALIITLIDTATGQRFSPTGDRGRMPPRGDLSSAPRQQRPQSGREITLQVPPGRYEVAPQPRGDAFLTGISARGAEVQGRFITVHEGDVTLTLHTADGRATVTGLATIKGRPSVGAVVLLVPAGLDDPGSFTTLGRDQSNTDGSFELEDIVPGQYILIAVDHGWQINWADPTTLRRYLTQGTPLDLGRSKNIRQNIEAQLP